jgi:NADPH-dependent curcumin reductase CurA
MALQASGNRNIQILLARRPQGRPQIEDFSVVESPIPEPGDGQVLVQALYLSLDPYMRGRMNDTKSYVPPVQIGEVMGGGVVGRVIKSADPKVPAGTMVEGLLGWQSHAVEKASRLRIVDPRLAPVSTALGVLGMPGITAYFGLLDICQPKAGETVVVSAASGAVGGVVGQIAKIRGCRTVGIVGSDAKAEYIVDDLGYDAAINHRTTPNIKGAIAAACPDGVDVYFDNVGGPITDAVVECLALHARVSLCGQISQYNNEKVELGPRNLWRLITTRSRMEGFIVFDFRDRYPEALKALAGWVSAGRIRYREDIVRGIENAPRAFLDLLEGENFGKRLIQIADDSQLPGAPS